MGTGLGPESYALIEQGRIGQILSSKPTDRRNIIEEAAGITKFKTRKRLAEARLADAKQNLARINDIFDEVTRQMNSLKRQAAKAERYAKLRDEMRDKLRIVLASRSRELESEAASSKQQLNELAEEIHATTEAVQAMESEHAERTQHGYAIDAKAKQTRERLNQLQLWRWSEPPPAAATTKSVAPNSTRAPPGRKPRSAAPSEQLQRLQDELAAERSRCWNRPPPMWPARSRNCRQRQQEAQQAARRR